MQSQEDAIRLAQTLIAVGNKFGKTTIGFLTEMSQPLGYAIGNWLEVVECIDCMKGADVPDLMEVTYVLGGAMVMLGGKAPNLEKGMAICRDAIASGSAFKKFKELVSRQGGDVSYLEDPKRYPRPKYSTSIRSAAAGDIESIDALELGFAAITLGAGRMKVDDTIDPKAGILLSKKAGDSINAGDTLADLFADNETSLDEAKRRVARAFNVATEPSVQPPLIHAVIDEHGVHPWHGSSLAGVKLPKK